MPKLSIKVDTDHLETYLGNIGKEDQIGFATSLALNKLAVSVQRSIREGITSRFQLRQRSWVLNRVYIGKENRASKEKRYVVVEVSEPRPILSGFEDGGDKVHFGGHSYFTVPNSKVFSGPIKADDPLRVSNLHLHMTPNGIEGNDETFMIKSKRTGTPLILQDMSVGQRRRKKGVNKTLGNRILYTLVKRVTLPAKLEFVTTAQSVINAEFQSTFEAAIKKAIDTAKK